MRDASDLDRRSFVLGRLRETHAEQSESHISSVVVHVRPELMDAVTQAVCSLSGAEIHARDLTGKFVLTLETRTEFEIVQHLNAIQNLPGVLSASLVFHHFEPDQP